MANIPNSGPPMGPSTTPLAAQQTSLAPIIGTSATPDPVPVGYRYALEEQRRLFDHVTQTANSLDQKFQALLSSASLIISLAGVIQLGGLLPSGNWFFWASMLLALTAYVSMVAIILYGLRASSIGDDNYLEPMERDWKTIKQRYRNAGEEQLLGYVIRNYLLATNENQKLVRRKMNNLKWATRLFVATVFITALSVLVGVII